MLTGLTSTQSVAVIPDGAVGDRDPLHAYCPYMATSHNLWHKHPAVNSGTELSVGERAADHLRNGMGSWPFVFSFIAFMSIWALVNSVALLHHWDEYPFILLNLFLSMLAGMQGAILLIAAKRQDQIASQLALHDYNTDIAARRDVALLRFLLEEVHKHVTGEEVDYEALMKKIDIEIGAEPN